MGYGTLRNGMHPYPRERVKEDELDIVLSPQRRSFGGGCHVTAAAGARRAGSPLEKENDCVRVIGGRRIGSGRIISARNFDKDHRSSEKDSRDARDVRERDRDREYKDKRFRREYGDSKRLFGERRRNDSYTEEEPEWFSAGPTSQSETIELIGFDDKILEEEHKGRKRTRRRTASLKGEAFDELNYTSQSQQLSHLAPNAWFEMILKVIVARLIGGLLFQGIECNGGVTEEEELQTTLGQERAADQEVPREMVLPESASGEFDFNEFFNLDKSVPGLASMIEDVLGEGSVSASRFSRWFSNPSRSGSRSSSLRSTPHEELERLAGLEQGILSPGQNSGNYFAPIPLEDHSENKVDILEMLQKAKVDLKPLLSSLSANKEKLRESTHSGVVLSVEEVEAGLKGLKMDQEGKTAAPLMAERMEESLNVADSRHFKDGDMSAFNKLQTSENPLMPPSEMPGQTATKNILQNKRALVKRLIVFLGFGPGAQQLLTDPFQGIRKSASPAAAQMNHLELQQAALQGLSLPHDLAMQVPNFYQPGFGKLQMDKNRDGFRNRQPRMTQSPASLGLRGNASSPPTAAASITSMLSPSFTPTSVIRKMYESKDKSKDEPHAAKLKSSEGEEGPRTTEEGLLPCKSTDHVDQEPSVAPKLTSLQRSACSTPLSQANRCTKEQDYRPKSSGRKTPTMASPVPGNTFLRPIHQVPLVPHVPMVRPPPQLPPGLVQRMLAQGIHPQHLPPLLQAGMIPPGVDLAHLQGVSAPLLGQPCYPLTTAGHPLLNPRSATPLQLAVMQQQLQRSGAGTQGSAVGVQTTPPPVSSRTGLPHMHSQLDHRAAAQRSSSPVGLAKWFGSDVLQQPLPSMPSKVISVDELEYRQ
ncbi:hypothetical protein Chor_000041 [Crotalus horridus]